MFMISAEVVEVSLGYFDFLLLREGRKKIIHVFYGRQRHCMASKMDDASSKAGLQSIAGVQIKDSSITERVIFPVELQKQRFVLFKPGCWLHVLDILPSSGKLILKKEKEEKTLADVNGPV